MNPAFSASNPLLHYRLDAVLMVALTIAACWFCRRHVRRVHSTEVFPLAACTVAIVLAMGSAIAAEWTTHLVGELTTNATGPGLATYHAAIYGGAALVIGIL